MGREGAQEPQQAAVTTGPTQPRTGENTGLRAPQNRSGRGAREGAIGG